MTASDPPTQLTPCFIPARVLLEDRAIEVTLTRLGRDRAQLSGELPLDVGDGGQLELNRPTDSRRVRVPFAVLKVHREGAQWGWKPAFHLQFDGSLDGCAPLTEEHVPLYPGPPAVQEPQDAPDGVEEPSGDLSPPTPPPLPMDEQEEPTQEEGQRAGEGEDQERGGVEEEEALPPGSWIGAVFATLESADEEFVSGDGEDGEGDSPLVPRPVEEPDDEAPPAFPGWATAPTSAGDGSAEDAPLADVQSPDEGPLTGQPPPEEPTVDSLDAPLPPWELDDLPTPPPMAGPFCDVDGKPEIADGVPRRSSVDSPWSSPSSAADGRVGRSARILAEAPATYHTAGKERYGTVQDFGRQGMFLAIAPSDLLPPAGAVVRVKFAIPRPDGPFSVRFTAEVRWRHGEDDAHALGRGMGLQIMDFPTPREREAYEAHVDALLAEID